MVAGDLRKGAAGGRHQRYAAGHGLDGRQGESLVERWNTGQFGLAIQLHYSFVGHPVHVGHAVGEPQVLEHLRRSTVLLRLSDDYQFDMAFGTQLGDGFQQVLQALHGYVGAGSGHDPTWHAFHSGYRKEQFRVDAHWHHVDAVRLDLVVRRNVAG